MTDFFEWENNELTDKGCGDVRNLPLKGLRCLTRRQGFRCAHKRQQGGHVLAEGAHRLSEKLDAAFLLWSWLRKLERPCSSKTALREEVNDFHPCTILPSGTVRVCDF